MKSTDRIIKEWDAIVSYMNDEIRESLHHELCPCTESEFLEAYLKREKDVEGEDLRGILDNEFDIDGEALEAFFAEQKAIAEAEAEKTFDFVFNGFEDGNALWAETDKSKIQATCNVPDGASEQYGYLTLKEAILDEIGNLGFNLNFIYEEDAPGTPFEEDASADEDVDLFVDINMPFYRIIDRIGDGDVFESKIYIDKAEAIVDCQSEWDHLAQHDKERTSAHYVAEYDCYDDAKEVLADHNVAYDVFDRYTLIDERYNKVDDEYIVRENASLVDIIHYLGEGYTYDMDIDDVEEALNIENDGCRGLKIIRL